MRKNLLSVSLSIAMLLTASTGRTEAWILQGDTLRVGPAKITLSARPATLSLRETGEFSEKGKGIDNFAQYISEDGAIAGTAYVYLVPYADAALTAFQTGRAINQRFGPDITLSETGITGTGTTSQGVIRRIYDQGAGNYTTTGAFLHVGNWMVKFRVSGPKLRRTEIVAALDAMIKGLTFEKNMQAEPAADTQPGQCPATIKANAKRLQLSGVFGMKSSDPMVEALLQGALTDITVKEGDQLRKQQTIARNGLQSVCVRETFGSGSNEILLLQANGSTDSPDAIIAVLNDAGDVLEMRRDEVRPGYALALHQVGRTTNYGTYTAPLSTPQLKDFLSGKGDYRPVSVKTYEASGETNNAITIQAR